MKNIVIIIGARPNFIKAFPVYEALKNYFNLTLIHTGQHFDNKMSKVFFEQLKFPYPDIHLTLSKKTKAGNFDDKLYINNEKTLLNKDKIINELINYKGDCGQLGEIRDKLKVEFLKIKPDLVIVFGDVTSTFAAALSAKSLNIKLAHVESGLRSGDIQMPEEVNRILTDHISTYYFITEQSGVDNLKKIGITENVFLVGNTMIDTQKKYLQQSLDTNYYKKINVKSKEYVLITLHRPSNVDNLNKLKEIFDDLEELSKKEILVYPIHPRTKNNLKKINYLKKFQDNQNIILDEPLGYLEFTCLLSNCKYLVTDSGGLQEESTTLNIPCFTLRENTERPSTFIKNNGTNQLINKINEIKLKSCKNSMKLWDGNTSYKIKTNIEILFNFNNVVKKLSKVEYTTKQKTINILNKQPFSIKEKINSYNLLRHCYCNHLANNKKFKKILIVGTGTGFQELLLERNNNNTKCVSVDIRRYKNFINEIEKFNNLSLVISDINNIEFKEKFDLVICMEVLEHINLKDLDNVINKLYSISKYHIFSIPFMETYYLYNELHISGHKKSWNLNTINKHFKNPQIKLLKSSKKNYWAFISNLFV